MISILLSQAQAACTSNPMRDIYLSSDFLVVTPTIQPGYQYLYNTGTKQSVFASSNPDSSYWCATQPAMLNITGSTGQCCSTSQLTTITKQFMSKYSYGLYLLSQNLISRGLNQLASSAILDKCKVRTNYQLSDLSERVKRSVNGMYYAVARMTAIALPMAQMMACLICADDSTASRYYLYGQLRVNDSQYNEMLGQLAQAAYSFNNALYSTLLTISELYLAEVFDLSTSLAGCSDLVNSMPAAAKWCTTIDNCTAEVTAFWTVSGLQFEAVISKVGGSARLLQARQLATVGNSQGAGFSSEQSFISNIKVNNSNIEQLKILLAGCIKAVIILSMALIG